MSANPPNEPEASKGTNPTAGLVIAYSAAPRRTWEWRGRGRAQFARTNFASDAWRKSSARRSGVTAYSFAQARGDGRANRRLH